MHMHTSPLVLVHGIVVHAFIPRCSASLSRQVDALPFILGMLSDGVWLLRDQISVMVMVKTLFSQLRNFSDTMW